MKKHRYVIADRSCFFIFCASVLLCCVVGAYLAGAAVTAKNAAAHSDIVYYSPNHFATIRGK